MIILNKTLIFNLLKHNTSGGADLIRLFLSIIQENNEDLFYNQRSLKLITTCHVYKVGDVLRIISIHLSLCALQNLRMFILLISISLKFPLATANTNSLLSPIMPAHAGRPSCVSCTFSCS